MKLICDSKELREWIKMVIPFLTFHFGLVLPQPKFFKRKSKIEREEG